MTYTTRQSDWQWLIEPEPGSSRCILKYKSPSDWTECSRFDTPEAAADAVASGRTGKKEWDELKRDPPVPGLAAWLIDPGAGPLSPILPIVGEVFKAAILPPKAENGRTS